MAASAFAFDSRTADPNSAGSHLVAFPPFAASAAASSAAAFARMAASAFACAPGAAQPLSPGKRRLLRRKKPLALFRLFRAASSPRAERQAGKVAGSVGAPTHLALPDG